MYYSNSKLMTKPRILFDPNNKDHVRDYARFVHTSNWKNGCQYLLEQPFHDIPAMINNKLIRHFLKPYMNQF